MGTVILADVTELTTVKISELPELISVVNADILPVVDASTATTKKVSRQNLINTADIDGGTW